jgi:hypothetical protein
MWIDATLGRDPRPKRAALLDEGDGFDDEFDEDEE